tara:strand:+ start:2297 stop:2548 length:252 start_codon:yes stop_codon:yes gene_type:complete
MEVYISSFSNWNLYFVNYLFGNGVYFEKCRAYSILRTFVFHMDTRASKFKVLMGGTIPEGVRITREWLIAMDTFLFCMKKIHF